VAGADRADVDRPRPARLHDVAEQAANRVE
jgi:hypothetical protein